MPRAYVLPALALVLAVSVAPVGAWWAGGHMLTAQVALDSGIMSMRTIDQVEAVIIEIAKYYPQSPEFVSSACWADDLKAEGAYQEAEWHYIDIPIESAISPPPAAPPAPNDMNVAWAITEAQSTVYGKKSTLLDKSRQLRFIVHFVGDVHQPLHAASYFSAQFPTGDAGGNAWPVAGVPYTNELHAVWDSGAGQWVSDLQRPLNSTGSAWLKAFASRIMLAHPASDPSIAPLILETNPVAWANESNAIASAFVYTAPQAPTPLSADYISQAQAIALKQIAVGGYRLATLLEYIFSAADERDRVATAWRAEALLQLAEAQAARARGDDELRLRQRRLRGAAA
jgi:hypothetical protein